MNSVRLTRRSKAAAAVVAGLVTVAGVALAGPASAGDEAESSPAARAAHAEALTPGTPCSVSARSCVDLESQQAWLIRDGKVIRV